MKTGGLTGRRRFRLETSGFWAPHGLLVLQVEESVWNDTVEGKPGKWVNVWRDATPKDVSEAVV